MLSHQYSTEELLSLLDSRLSGLTEQEAHLRLARHGSNELQEKERTTPLQIFLGQFKDFMIIVLMLSAVVSGLLGDIVDTISIMIIVLLNAIIGFFQEYRAEQAMAALKRMAALTALVLREGSSKEIPAAEIVPGDIVLMDAGRVVPADIRLLEAVQARTDEAALTGESLPVEKSTATLSDEIIPIGDRHNMLFKGTSLSSGRTKGVVVATGMQTELGKIAALLQEEQEVKTPLQKRLADFGRRLALLVLLICAVVFGVGILRGEDALLMLLTAISLAVAAIPEALPAVVTIALSRSAKRMIQKQSLIRKLPAVETLGSVSYICSDKTGTLTRQNMKVTQVWSAERGMRELQPQSSQAAPTAISPTLGKAMCLNSDVVVNADGSLQGEQTEIALVAAALATGYNKKLIEEEQERIAEIPFDSSRKLMTTVHRTSAEGQACISYTKGAPDILLRQCTKLLNANGVEEELDRDSVLQQAEAMAARGLRVIAYALRRWEALPQHLQAEEQEQDLVCIGMAGMIDPPREEVREAVARCKQAGIIPVMITGDHPLTAQAIAKEIGIISDEHDLVLNATQLDSIAQEEFEAQVEQIRVYARVAPEQKLRIVKALQEKGHFVAMTGDGVNDAPALKRADIGVAMGINGTDVSKEAAGMILLDDNFATIVNAVEEGRRVFDNIRKFIKYTMTSNAGEIWTIFLAPFFGLPIPLLPIHILWINLVTDGLPGLALAAEPAEGNVMRRPPRHPKESIFAQGMATHIVWVGLLMGMVPIAMQAAALRWGDTHWQTMVFTVLCLSQMGHVLAIRSERQSLFSLGLFSNKPLVLAFLSTFVLQMATIYVPVLNPVFRTEPLTLTELLIALGASCIVFIAVEIEKAVRRRKETKEETAKQA